MAVTEPVDEDQFITAEAASSADDEPEVVDALPVPDPLRDGGPPPPPSPARAATARGGAIVSVSPTAVQAAAVAVTGFAAGAVTVAAIRRRRVRKATKKAARKPRTAIAEIRATRSFLVDVHLLDRG